MSKKYIVTIVIAIVVVFIMCTGVVIFVITQNQVPAVSHGGEVKDQVSFIDELRKQTNGLVTFGSNISQPFLSVQGTTLTIDKLNSAPIQIYEYDSSGSMQNEMLNISADGSTGHTNSGGVIQIDWISTPHLYSKGRIIVIYIGNDKQVDNVLTNILGNQFAGK